MQKLKNKLTQRQWIIIGVFIIMIGIFLLSFNYINIQINHAYDLMNIKLLENENPSLSYSMPGESNKLDEPVSTDDSVSTVPKSTVAPSPSPTTKPVQTYYIGTLEIPKISFKRGFVSKTSKLNTVSKNITILNASDYPDQKKGNFIIAAHSGNSSIAYFTNLYKLQKQDIAIVYYKNKKYTYQIVNIYLQPKTGKLSIYRDKNKDTLTLITCTRDDSQNQTVYIAEKIKEENI